MRPLNSTDRPYIANYRLLRRLAPGGMGEVFLGRAEDGSILVVKIVSADESGVLAGRFQSEMEATSRVRGQYVARIRGMDPYGSPPWLATDYYPGPSLLHAVSSAGPLPPASVHALAAGLCHALIAIHRAGVVHGDLTPGNVLLLADGPRVIDFGISGLLEASRPLDGPRFGTPGYVAPESYGPLPAGPAGPSPAGDVYALGAVLFYALTGAAPPLPVDATALWQLPEPLRGVIQACTALNPAQRPTPEQLLAEALVPAGLPIESMFGEAWLPADVIAGIHYGEAELVRLMADPAPHVQLDAAAVPPPPPTARAQRIPALSPSGRIAVIVAVVAAVVAAGAVTALGDTFSIRPRPTATAGPATTQGRPGASGAPRTTAAKPGTTASPQPPQDDGMVEDGPPGEAAATRCAWTARPANKRALPYRCPLLWDSSRTTDDMQRIPLFADYRTGGLTPGAAINQLHRSAGAQYFKCHIRGASYDFAPQYGWGQAHHLWWALTQGDQHPGGWGFVPEVYFLGGADNAPDPGLIAVCTDADVALAA
jgi:hypothetical protein